MHRLLHPLVLSLSKHRFSFGCRVEKRGRPFDKLRADGNLQAGSLLAGEALQSRRRLIQAAARQGALGIAALLLAGCGRASADYRTLKELPPGEWTQFAARLPIERQLDLYLEVQRSSHNPPQTITESFGGKPSETYRALVDRIRRGDTSRHYQGVLYEIDRNPSFAICDQPDRKVVQDFLWSIATNAVKPSDRPAFYRC